MILRVVCCCISMAALLTVGRATGAGFVDAFDDIVYWTGAGAQRAAIVIDFDGESSTDLSLVWGFRWDGAAKGRDMINAIVTADPRLYLRVADQGTIAEAVLGVGYDRTNDGAFAITQGGPFDADGFAYGAPNEDVSSVDPGDWYREGWEYDFWHYGFSESNPWDGGAWTSSQEGAHRRTLKDGEWNSWAYTIVDDPIDFTPKYAEQPVIATPPSGYADFDGDRDVDGADFLIWQRGFGVATPTPMDGDATGDGRIDGADLAAWRGQFGAQSLTAPTTARAFVATPEPTFWTTCASAMFVLIPLVRQLRRSDS